MFSWDEWDALPWWQARAYTERLNEELRAKAGSGDLDEPAPEVTMAPRVNEQVLDAIQSGDDVEDMPIARARVEEMGARVIEVQFGQAEA
jgi:hypothetical protein